jgi:hypothetical protein
MLFDVILCFIGYWNQMCVGQSYGPQVIASIGAVLLCVSAAKLPAHFPVRFR